MTWLVRYRAASGQVVTVAHDTREGARDALVDRLLESALTLWAIGESMSTGVPGQRELFAQGYFDRGDRFIHHAARLMGTTEDAYIIAGAGNRKWVLCEVSTHPHPSPATATYEGLTDEEWHDMPPVGMDS